MNYTCNNLRAILYNRIHFIAVGFNRRIKDNKALRALAKLNKFAAIIYKKSEIEHPKLSLERSEKSEIIS